MDRGRRVKLIELRKTKYLGLSNTPGEGEEATRMTTKNLEQPLIAETRGHPDLVPTINLVAGAAWAASDYGKSWGFTTNLVAGAICVYP